MKPSEQQFPSAGFEQHFHADPLSILYRHWQEMRSDKVAPAREDLDFARIIPVLPNLGLVDVEENPRRYRMRLLGADIVTGYGCDMVGVYVDELDVGDGLPAILLYLNQAVELAVPAYLSSEYTKQDGRLIRNERLALPLSSNGKKVDMIIVGAFALPDDAPVTGINLDI